MATDKLTPKMQRYINDLANGRDPSGHLWGASQRGGYSRVIFGLCRRGLMGVVDGKYTLTEAGRARAKIDAPKPRK